MQADAHLLCLHNEAPYILLKQPLSFGRADGLSLGDHRSDTWPDFEPLLRDQMVNDLLSRVRVDFQLGCQRAHGRKWLPS